MERSEGGERLLYRCGQKCFLSYADAIPRWQSNHGGQIHGALYLNIGASKKNKHVPGGPPDLQGWTLILNKSWQVWSGWKRSSVFASCPSLRSVVKSQGAYTSGQKETYRKRSTNSSCTGKALEVAMTFKGRSAKLNSNGFWVLLTYLDAGSLYVD